MRERNTLFLLITLVIIIVIQIIVTLTIKNSEARNRNELEAANARLLLYKKALSEINKGHVKIAKAMSEKITKEIQEGDYSNVMKFSDVFGKPISEIGENL